MLVLTLSCLTFELLLSPACLLQENVQTLNLPLVDAKYRVAGSFNIHATRKVASVAFETENTVAAAAHGVDAPHDDQ